MKRQLLCWLWLCPVLATAQPPALYPKEVELVLQKAGANRTELEKAIDYFSKQGDAEKKRAIEFLISNMDIHSSSTYYWADSTGRRVNYNEFDYPSFNDAVKAFEQLKQQVGALHPVATIYRDMDTVTADFLIKNTELAFERWRAHEPRCSFTDFCEYVLPYRVSIEPLQDWRNYYANRFTVSDKAAAPAASDTLLRYIGNNVQQWFTNIYGIEERKEPLPRLGAMQLLFRKKGACEDIADLACLMARVNGIPATVDFIPAWATASGNHYMTYVNISDFPKHHFDASDNTIVDSLSREPAKVIRTTYSKQPYTAAAIADTAQIPHGFMRTYNYRDVTSEYWVTRDVPAQLFVLKNKMPAVAFACVWNYMKWRPVWWGKVVDDKTVFTNMCKGAIFLPVFFVKNKQIPAGWPIAAGYNNTLVLKPDTSVTRTIHIAEQVKYLAFRTGKKYTLFYWNNRWVKAGVKTADTSMKELVFDNVPSNALMLLVPEYSEHKERPFIITNDNKRLWF
jgi:hypothetical protein